MCLVRRREYRYTTQCGILSTVFEPRQSLITGTSISDCNSHDCVLLWQRTKELKNKQHCANHAKNVIECLSCK